MEKMLLEMWNLLNATGGMSKCENMVQSGVWMGFPCPVGHGGCLCICASVFMFVPALFMVPLPTKVSSFTIQMGKMEQERMTGRLKLSLLA